MPMRDGEYVRSPNHFADRPGHGPWPIEPGRYRLVASLACPWANRALIVRRLLGLESAISVGIVDPIQDEKSWRFTLDPEDRDPVLGITYLAEAYHAADPHYMGGVSVPVLVDVPSGRLVSNDYPQITLDFSTEWTAHHRPGAPDLYPEPLRDEIDEISEDIFRDVNNGVYRAGFAESQRVY
jgi:putative glutathione S-transferase